MSLWPGAPQLLARPPSPPHRGARRSQNRRARGRGARLVKSMAPNSFGGWRAAAGTRSRSRATAGCTRGVELVRPVGGGAGRDDASRPQAVPAFTGCAAAARCRRGALGGALCGRPGRGRAAGGALLHVGRARRRPARPSERRCARLAARGRRALRGAPRDANVTEEARDGGGRASASRNSSRSRRRRTRRSSPPTARSGRGGATRAAARAPAAERGDGAGAGARAPARARRAGELRCGAHARAHGKGKVLAFGLNATGQLGSGGASNGATPTPAAVRLPAGVAGPSRRARSAVRADGGGAVHVGYGGCGSGT